VRTDHLADFNPQQFNICKTIPDTSIKASIVGNLNLKKKQLLSGVDITMYAFYLNTFIRPKAT